MRKIFHFESPREQYQCDAAIVWCFDSRFELGFRKFLKHIGVTFADPIKIAGGAKSLASPSQESDRTFVLDQIRTSMQLHNTSRVILMLHSDCGAYGGLAGGFGGDPQKEFAHHKLELRKAAQFLHRSIPEISVDAYFVNFEGVWDTDLWVDTPATSETASSAI